jgi:hypothetical protein
MTAMRGRLADAGMVVTTTNLGDKRLEITLSGVHTSRSDRLRLSDLGDRGQIFFYDWERNVLGSRARPAPLAAAVTGGPDAGDPQFGLSLYAAVIRGSRRRLIRRPNDTTGRLYYLVDDHSHKVVRGPTHRPQDLLATGRPTGSRTVQIRPGTVILEAQRPEYVPHPKEDKYYVLNDDPALSNADIVDPQAGTDGGLGGTGQPDVSIAFPNRGARLFDLLTRQIAHRGELVARTGVPAPASYQHYGVVVDDRLVSVPAVDYLESPNGLNAAAGTRIVGGFTDTTAEDLASILRYRPLPVALLLESVRNPALVRKPGGPTPPGGGHRGR